MTVRSNYHTSVSTMIAIALYNEVLECSQVHIHKAAVLQPRLRLAVAQSQYVPINAHATWQPRSVDREQWQPIQHSQLRQHGEFRHVSVSERSVITAVWSESSCACHRKSNRALEQWRLTARQKRSYLHHQGEFQHIIISSFEPLLPTGLLSQNRCS